ncbi:MAG: hypothetical protein ACYTE3_31490 [Planctomycetota bacterium]
MKNKNTTVTLIWAAVVLVAATGLGYGIRQIRWSRAIRKNLSEPMSDTQVVDGEPEVETESLSWRSPKKSRSRNLPPNRSASRGRWARTPD